MINFYDLLNDENTICNFFITFNSLNLLKN